MKRFLNLFSTTDVRNIIAIIFTGLVLSFVFALIFFAVPETNKDLVNVVGGTVFGNLGLILGYYFGASKGEKKEAASE